MVDKDNELPNIQHLTNWLGVFHVVLVVNLTPEIPFTCVRSHYLPVFPFLRYPHAGFAFLRDLHVGRLEKN